MKRMRAADIRLRPAALPDDVDLALPWYADPDVMHFSEGVSTPYDRATVTRMYEYFAREGELFIIEAREPTRWLLPWRRRRWRAIGDAALCRHTVPIAIGDPAYRSRGIGSHVLHLLIARARKQRWPSVEVHGVFAFNERSLRMYRSAGFTDIGERIDEDGARRIRLALQLD